MDCSTGLRYDPPASDPSRWDTFRPPFGSASLGVSAGRIIARGRRVRAWGLDANFPHTAAEPPHSPVPDCSLDANDRHGSSDPCSGEEEEVVLVPYGECKPTILQGCFAS